jgi:hypothetical protein
MASRNAILAEVSLPCCHPSLAAVNNRSSM